MKTQIKRGRGGQLGAVILAILATGCTPEASGEPVESSSDDSDVFSTWTASSTSGASVTLRTPNPLEPGSTSIDIRLVDGPAEVLPITLDLVSPDMPMHGVVRFDAHAVSPGSYRASVELPMEGYWELYVNLDYGADAALFELDVVLPAGVLPHQHAAPDSPDGSGRHAGHIPQS